MNCYDGPDRRVHTIFVTKNTEYHVCSDLCVAVRHRKSGVWISSHEAVGMLVSRSVGKPFLGHPLTLSAGGSKIRTSNVVDIIRPGRSTVAMYDLLWAVCPSVFSPQLPAERAAS